MEESGNRPSIRISRKRLSKIVIALALFGSFVLGMLWQDSTRFYTHIFSSKYSLVIESSAIELLPFEHDTDKALNFYRDRSDDEKIVFPAPYLDRQTIFIPIYLIILAYLATLLLIWLLLMNRLARREFMRSGTGG